MFTSSKLTRSVRLAAMFGAASATAFAPSVMAQEAEATAVEKISVTGSRIKRVDMESASPVSVFTAEDIAAAGVPTIEDFIQSIPSMNGGAAGSTVNNGNAGFATAALRGLGSGRTLVLINGRRYASSDLNAIPTSLVERVDVLRDGASTSYGSDAIAGVVNIITKRGFEGAEITAQYDITGEGDGEQTKFSIITGISNDKGNVVLNIDYTNREAIGQGDRSYSECPLWDDGAGNGEPYCGGSSHSHYGRANLSDANSLGLSAGRYVVIDGNVVPFSTPDHGYNYAALSYLVTPQEVFSMNALADYELTDNITLFTEASYTGRQSDQLMAPVATFWGAPVAIDHPNNIFGEAVSVNRRLTETGGRNFTQDANDYRIVAGLEGDLDNGISWDIAYNYSRFIDARIIAGQINRPRMEALLDPAACDADSACPGIWDPFTRGTLTDEQIAYASITHSPVTRSTTTQLLGNISGDMGDIELPGGQILWAAGFEHRTEDYLFMPDGGAAIGAIYYVSGEKTEGAYAIDELYGEVMLPIIADMPFAERVDVTIAVRSSDYDFLDETATNSKVGIEWVPVEDMLVRATFAEGFRAPSISELFAPQRQSAPSYSDPCRNYGTSGANSTVTANCQADGLAPNFNPDSQAAAVLGGNPGLTPEDSESFTAGIVYSGFDNFSIALDYFDIEITNGVGTAGVNNVAEGCYNSPGFSSPLCDLIKGSKYGPIDTPPHPTSPRRNVSGILSGVLLTNANLSTFQTSGIDFDFTYTTEMMGGEVKASVNGTLLNDYSYSLIEGEEMVEVAGYFAEDQWEGRPATFNELKVNATVTYTADDYSVNVSTRYFSETDDINGTENTYDAIAEAAFYIDLQGTYFINDNYSVSGGVRNLMDEEPPYMSNYDDMNTINGNYDLAGRYFYTKFTAKF